MADLQKRLDTYINSEHADPLAVGLICELQAHLRAANKGSARVSGLYQSALRSYWDVTARISDIEKRLPTPPAEADHA